jgi:putative sigma-54 modulation protein
MHSQFSFRHMDASDAVREYAEERLEKVKRYFADPIKISGTFSVEHKQHLAQFDVTLRNGLELHSSEATENMYSSIDMALAKMERQVRRYKDKIKTHRASSGQSAKFKLAVLAEESGLEIPVLPADGPSLGTEPAADEGAGARVVREREFAGSRLTIDEAIMQLNLLHNAFLVFTNAGSGEINVIYRRDDGNYGLIETHARVTPGG